VFGIYGKPPKGAEEGPLLESYVCKCRSIRPGLPSRVGWPGPRAEGYVYQPLNGKDCAVNVKYPSEGEVELVLETDSKAFTMPRVRDEAVTVVRKLIRLTEVSACCHVVGWCP
jgi:hypothetical protein